MTTPDRILVCRTDALGDAILALPVCTALRQAYPGARLQFLVAAAQVQLFQGQAGVDEVLGLDVSAGRAGWRKLHLDLTRERADLALLVFPDRRVSWAIWRAGIPVRVGTARRWWSGLYTRRVPHSRARAVRHEADYNLDLVRALGLRPVLTPPVLTVEAGAALWADTYLRSRGLGRADRLVLIHPGSRGSASNWSPGQYAELAAALGREHRVRVLVTGSAAERPLVEVVSRQADPHPWVLDPPVDLVRFAALIARAGAFVSGSTGPMHLAAALDVPTVSIFPGSGVTGPQRWAPLHARALVLTPPSQAGDPRALGCGPALQAVRRHLDFTTAE